MDWLLTQFLDLKYSEGRSKQTLRYYEEVLTLFCRHLGKTLEEAAREDILDFSKALRDSDNAPATVANRVRGVKSFYKACFEYELLPVNPAEKVRVPKTPKQHHRILTVEEAQRMLRGCEQRRYTGARNYNLVLVLLDTALRNSEVSGLKVDHVRLKHAAPSMWVVSGKGDKDRQVSLHPRTARSLLRYLPERESFLRRNHIEDGGYLFLTKNGGRLDKDDVQDALQRVCKSAGVPPVRPHDLRHTSATWAALDGMNAYQLAAKLGHSSISTTMIYVHMAEQMRAQWTSHSPIGVL
ncbi:MAG: tyrosine-type recombinase/integrase [Symbiobacteriia bacterium]